MFSALFVCLFVCLLATLHKNFRTDLHEIFRVGWQLASEHMIKSWCRSGSRKRRRNALFQWFQFFDVFTARRLCNVYVYIARLYFQTPKSQWGYSQCGRHIRSLGKNWSKLIFDQYLTVSETVQGMYVAIHRVSEKTVQISFCQNFVKFPQFW